MDEDKLITANVVPTPQIELQASGTPVDEVLSDQRKTEQDLLTSATQEVTAVIGTRLPSGEIIEHADSIGEGWNSRAFMVQMRGRPKHIFLLLKTKDASTTVQSLTKAQPLLTEIETESPAKFPHIAFSSTEEPPFVGYPALPGQPLAKIFLELEPDEKMHVAQGMAQSLRKLHGVTPEQAEKHGIRKEDLLGKYEYYFGENFLEREIAPHLDAAEYNTLCKFARQVRANPDFLQYQPRLIHGDLSLDNVIFERSSRALGIIDMEKISVSDPDKDIWHFCRTLPAELQREFLEEYGHENLQLLKKKMSFFDVYRGLYLTEFRDKDGIQSLKGAIKNISSDN